MLMMDNLDPNSTLRPVLEPAPNPADDVDREAFMGRSIRNGHHDFDVEIGTWATHLRRLEGPLTGSSEWLE